MQPYLSSNPRRTRSRARGECHRRRRALPVGPRPDLDALGPARLQRFDSDVAGAGFSYTEKFVADRRPFFQDGRAFFGDWELFHSGRIEDFDVGVKTFGRVDDYQVGVLATTEADSERADYVGRVARDVGRRSTSAPPSPAPGARTLENTAVQVQAGGRLGRFFQVDGQVAVTDTAGAPGDGTRERAEIAYRRARLLRRLGRQHRRRLLRCRRVPAGRCGRHDRPWRLQRLHPPSGQSWLRTTDASVSYQVRETHAGEFHARRPASMSVPTPPPTSS